MQKTIITDLAIDEVSFAKSPAMATDLIMKDDSFDDSDFDENGMLKDATFKPSNVPADAPEDQSEVARSTRVRSKLEDALDSMARNLAAEKNIDFYEAYAEVSKTSEGLELLEALNGAAEVQAKAVAKAALDPHDA